MINRAEFSLNIVFFVIPVLGIRSMLFQPCQKLLCGDATGLIILAPANHCGMPFIKLGLDIPIIGIAVLSHPPGTFNLF